MKVFQLCWTLAFLALAVTGCVSISEFASLFSIPADITSSAVAIKIRAITAGNKNYKSIIKKKKKRHDQIVFLGEAKLNTIGILIFKSLIGFYISHEEFDSVNNVLREYNEMKGKKILKLLWNILKTIETCCISCKKYTVNKNSSIRKTKQNRLMPLSNCLLCGNKKSTFIKNRKLHIFNNISND